MSNEPFICDECGREGVRVNGTWICRRCNQEYHEGQEDVERWRFNRIIGGEEYAAREEFLRDFNEDY